MHTRGLLTLAASCLALGTVDQATASHNGQVFSFTNRGMAGCRSDSFKITSAHDCRVAAPKLGLMKKKNDGSDPAISAYSSTSSSYLAARPLGCYFNSGTSTLWYNPSGYGVSAGKSKDVLRWSLCNTPTSDFLNKPTYVKMEAALCDSASMYIPTDGRCETAAKYLKQKDTSEKAPSSKDSTGSASRPKGCYYHNGGSKGNHLFFNDGGYINYAAKDKDTNRKAICYLPDAAQCTVTLYDRDDYVKNTKVNGNSESTSFNYNALASFTTSSITGETFTLSSTARKEVNSIKMYGNCGYMKVWDEDSCSATSGDNGIFASSQKSLANDLDMDVCKITIRANFYGTHSPSPTRSPTARPTAPTRAPTARPTAPTTSPTASPTKAPTTRAPTNVGDTWAPTTSPTKPKAPGSSGAASAALGFGTALAGLATIVGLFA